MVVISEKLLFCWKEMFWVKWRYCKSDGNKWRVEKEQMMVCEWTRVFVSALFIRYHWIQDSGTLVYFIVFILKDDYTNQKHALKCLLYVRHWRISDLNLRTFPQQTWRTVSSLLTIQRIFWRVFGIFVSFCPVLVSFDESLTLFGRVKAVLSSLWGLLNEQRAVVWCEANVAPFPLQSGASECTFCICLWLEQTNDKSTNNKRRFVSRVSFEPEPFFWTGSFWFSLRATDQHRHGFLLRLFAHYILTIYVYSVFMVSS